MIKIKICNFLTVFERGYVDKTANVVGYHHIICGKDCGRTPAMKRVKINNRTHSRNGVSSKDREKSSVGETKSLKIHRS